MTTPSSLREAEVLVANLSRGYAGVAATMRALVPLQQRERAVAFLDRARMGLAGSLSFAQVLREGWSAPPCGTHRIWHSRRAPEQIVGVVLRDVLRQCWKLVYTSPSPRRHGAFWRWFVRRSDAVIAVTPRAAAFLDWHSAIVPHGVDIEEFAPPVDRAVAWREAGLPGDFCIGIFGRIRPSKGTDLFIDAVCEVLPRHPRCTAVLTGLCQPGEERWRDALLAKVRAAGLEQRVVFLGDLPFREIKRWYQRVSLCVAVPRSEGFGLTPLEAMASGAAALTSREGCFPELIVPDQNGDIVPTGDARALALALERLIARPEELAAMGARARAHVVAHWSIAREVQGIHALYDATLTGRAPRISTRS
ncbi:MAG: glycosyltransferase family 4 protein [Planctomycetota bacterium]